MPVNSTSRTEPTAETREANGSFLALGEVQQGLDDPGARLELDDEAAAGAAFAVPEFVHGYSFAARRMAVSTRAAMA